MATAFSYSGTGLESAIQSGSGGIGTGSSITLEVDTVPSDLSQGDTVKVALGPASDWAAGNGETAYGDIGGAGANGGTNITLTDRGQEGTTASSFSEGDPVRVGVQGRDDVGPESAVVGSEIVAASERLTHYADFSGVTRADADGYTIASGQTLTVQRGAWEIKNGLLRPTTTPSIITFPATELVVTFHTKMYGPDPDETADGGPIAEYIDNNNYLYINLDSGNIQSKQKVSGSFSTNDTSNLVSTEMFERLTRVGFMANERFGYRARAFTPGTAASMAPDSSLKQATTKGFVGVTSKPRIESFRIYAPNIT
jgi:hypothetical protein